MYSARLPAATLLEDGKLPYADLVRFASREGRRARPIYQIHKWFARRLGCTFRALLVGAVSSTTADFWKAYYETADLKGLTVLDPFVGGGTSVVEAARLGASAVGVDVDPIACAVTTAELRAAKLPDLGPVLLDLKESVGKSIAPLHLTKGSKGERLAVIHHFWVQLVTCPACEHVGEAHPSFVLAEEPKQSWVFCRACHTIRSIKNGQRRFACRDCSAVTDLSDAPVRNGSYTCRDCSHEVSLIAHGRQLARPPAWHLFAVEASPRTSGRSVPMRERRFLRASNADRKRVAQASDELRKELENDPDFLPRVEIDTTDREDTRLIDYGYRRWTDLFNDRQLLHLGRLARAIKQLPEEQRSAIGLAFSNHLTTNCMLTAYAAGWRRLTPLFSIRAFRHVPRPVEVNPWSEGTGRGTFPNAVRQVTRATAFAKSPQEPARRGGFQAVAAVQPSAEPRVLNGNARDLAKVASRSVDVVLTDPPYFDNVAYSELSDFFQPWLEHLGLVPSAKKRRALINGALRADRSRDESADDFASELGEAFREVRRVLKPNGILAFTFRHSTSSAWLAMARALRRSNLQPVTVLPMPGEAGTSLHTHDGTSLWDAVLVFRKVAATGASEMLDERQINAARKNVRYWRERLRRQEKLPFNDADYTNLLRASLVAASLGLYGATRRGATSIEGALSDAAI